MRGKVFQLTFRLVVLHGCSWYVSGVPVSVKTIDPRPRVKNKSFPQILDFIRTTGKDHCICDRCVLLDVTSPPPIVWCPSSPSVLTSWPGVCCWMSQALLLSCDVLQVLKSFSADFMTRCVLLDVTSPPPIVWCHSSPQVLQCWLHDQVCVAGCHKPSSYHVMSFKSSSPSVLTSWPGVCCWMSQALLPSCDVLQVLKSFSADFMTRCALFVNWQGPLYLWQVCVAGCHKPSSYRVMSFKSSSPSVLTSWPGVCCWMSQALLLSCDVLQVLKSFSANFMTRCVLLDVTSPPPIVWCPSSPQVLQCWLHDQVCVAGCHKPSSYRVMSFKSSSPSVLTSWPGVCCWMSQALLLSCDVLQVLKSFSADFMTRCVLLDVTSPPPIVWCPSSPQVLQCWLHDQVCALCELARPKFWYTTVHK